MDTNIQEREFGWTESSESNDSLEEYDGDLDMAASSNDDLDLHAPWPNMDRSFRPTVKTWPSSENTSICVSLAFSSITVGSLCHTFNNSSMMLGTFEAMSRWLVEILTTTFFTLMFLMTFYIFVVKDHGL